MIAVFADTHGTENPQLAGRAADVLEDAERTLHAGDFTTGAVYDAFKRRAQTLIAVHGNSDASSLQNQLPAVRTIEWRDWQLLLVHGHEHTPTSLSLLAREREADLVVTGHTHRPAIGRLGEVPVLNPGSHAEPRTGPPTHAELREQNRKLVIEIRDQAGGVVERERVTEA